MMEKIYRNLVLIAENNYDLYKIISLFLEKEGFSVLRAHNGKVAELLLSIYYDELAFCILDVSLPKKYGESVLKYMKNEDKLKDIPVIMISNLKDEEDIKSLMDLGALAHIKKQKSSVHEIMNKLKEALISSGTRKINFKYGN